MRFETTDIPDLLVAELVPFEDERGTFTRVFSVDDLKDAGVEMEAVQVSVSFTRRRGTVRGMHFQRAPHEEIKIVRCSRGAIFDVIIDVRPSSPGFGRWQAFELRPEEPRALIVPKGCAHGFQTLEDDCEVHYIMSHRYVPEAASGVRWDDPAFGIPWPLKDDALVNERDATYPDFEASR